MVRNKVGGEEEEEERRHLLFEVDFIQKPLFTARTKISIQLFISGSLDSLHKWKKRDIDSNLVYACLTAAQVNEKTTRHIFLATSLWRQDKQFFCLAAGAPLPCSPRREVVAVQALQRQKEANIADGVICLQLQPWDLQQSPHVALLLPTSPKLPRMKEWHSPFLLQT